jgi:hypothetical protein
LSLYDYHSTNVESTLNSCSEVRRSSGFRLTLLLVNSEETRNLILRLLLNSTSEIRDVNSAENVLNVKTFQLLNKTKSQAYAKEMFSFKNILRPVGWYRSKTSEKPDLDSEPTVPALQH